MVSFTATAGAAAPQRAAACSAQVITCSLTKGRAASCMASSSPLAAITPLRTLCARVLPPRTTCTGLRHRAASCSTHGRFSPATRINSVTSGCASKASMLRCKTVFPPRSAVSLSNPMRREAPAATRIALTVLFIWHCPFRLLIYYTKHLQKNPALARKTQKQGGAAFSAAPPCLRDGFISAAPLPARRSFA